MRPSELFAPRQSASSTLDALLAETDSVLDRIADSRLGRIVAVLIGVALVAGLLLMAVDAAVTLLTADYAPLRVSELRPVVLPDNARG